MCSAYSLVTISLDGGHLVVPVVSSKQCPDLVCSARSVHRSAGPVSETQVTQVELAVRDKHTIIDNLADAY